MEQILEIVQKTAARGSRSAMYRWFSYCRSLALAGVLLFVSAELRQAHSSDAPAEQGLDLIVLVDVSASMYTDLQDRSQDEDYPSGSDPERIRWDAVKLVADLLTPEDRLLIQRFNHECPASYVSRTGRPASHLESEGDLPRRPLRPEDDFPLQYRFPWDEQRADLEQRIDLFNTTSDWRGSTDQGETRIFHALNVVADRVGPPAPGRTTHVVLLTDGVDNEYQAGRFRTDESLRAALRHYTGELPGRAPIPIHTIGLGLFRTLNAVPREPAAADNDTCLSTSHDDHDPSAEGPLAQQLLLRMSSLTNGNYYRVDSNRDLIRVFLSLIRDLKGAWFQSHSFPPNTTGQTRSIAPVPVQGIVDLGILAYDLNPPAAGVKRATAPPAKPVAHHWVGLGGQPAPVPVRRSGKGGTLYEQIYFGRTTPGETAKSPFADLPSSARLGLSLHGDERPQELVLIKRTQNDLFTMIQPAQSIGFHRYQRLQVQVAMADSAFFRPDQFELTARLFCAGGAAADEPRRMLQESRLVALPGTNRFRGALRLAELPTSGEDEDSYMLVVTVNGKPQLDNSLAGFQRDLPARTITVANHLALQSVAPLELTEAKPNAIVPIATTSAVDEPLTLYADFVPFQRESRTITLDGFVFATTQGPIAEMNVPLTRGQARIAIGFRRDAKLPQGGVVYEPGKIVIRGDERLGIEPLEIPVHLRLALARVALDQPELTLEAKPMPVASQVAHIRLEPPDQARTELGELQATIRPVPGGNAADDPSGMFSPRELWLQASGDPASSDARSQSLRLQLNEPFQVFLHPDGSKPAGKYFYEVVVTGSGVDSSRTPLVVSVDVPTLELDSTDVTIHADPGSVGFAEVPLRLQGIGREPLPVHIRQPAGKATFTFVNEDPQVDRLQVELAVECPQPANPLLLAWPAETEAAWNSLPFRVHVPAETPYGRYRCESLITGDQVADQRLTLRLIVNALVVEVPFASEDGGMLGWHSPAEMRLLQFLGHDMKKTIRIRTGLGDSIPPDELQVTPQAPFADESGDAMPLPRVLSVEEVGDALQVTLQFRSTPNAHIERPYWARVQLVCPGRHLRPVHVPFRVRFWTPEQFLESSASR